MARIELQNVHLNIPIYGISSRSLKSEFIRITTGGMLNRNKDSNVATVNALDNVNLTIEHGDRVGLIGHNGAGKSTLLRMLAGIYEPTQGHAVVDGRVTALLDVMMGLDPESTGYDNILLRGILHGLTFTEIRRKQKEIAEFTDLGGYLNMPIRTYSSGMQLRLAFAIATNVVPEILILDEIVGAGDASFMHKAKKKIDELIVHSEIVIIASHSMDILHSLCNKVIWLDAGKVAYYGVVSAGIEQYEEAVKSSC